MYDKTFVGKVQKVAVRLSFMKSKNENMYVSYIIYVKRYCKP